MNTWERRNAILKSWENSDWRRKKKKRRKTEIVQELITEFSLDILLKAIKLARSTYYYHLKQLEKPDKDHGLKAEINLFLLNTREIMAIVGYI